MKKENLVTISFHQARYLDIKPSNEKINEFRLSSYRLDIFQNKCKLSTTTVNRNSMVSPRKH